MRQMRYIANLFFQSKDFDEQQILFKAYLNTIHSLSDNDIVAKNDFQNNELMNFILVLRNILHHYPAKNYFGKHDVCITEMNIVFKKGEGTKIGFNQLLVIPKNTLEDPDLQNALAQDPRYKKQLTILQESLEKIQGPLFVSNIIQNVQAYVEQYCKQNGHYTEKCDNKPIGYKPSKNIP